MGYLFLLIALLAGATKGYCGKKTSGYTNDFRDAILANIVRMVFCAIIGFMLVFLTEGAGNVIPDKETLLISALSGVATSVFVVTWLISVKKSAYMMLDIFLMLGILIPLIESSVFFDEKIKTTNIANYFYADRGQFVVESAGGKKGMRTDRDNKRNSYYSGCIIRC